MKKGINRNQLRGGVVLSYISKIIKVVIGLLYTPVMIGLLGQSEYGLYNIAASLVAYLGLLNFGFGSSYVRFFSQYKVNGEEKKIENLNAMSLIIFSLMGAIAVIAGIILSYNVDIFFGASLSSNEINTAQTLMRVLVINLAVSFPNIVLITICKQMNGSSLPIS